MGLEDKCPGFYYDPILGLQYDDINPIIVLDLGKLPSDINAEEFIEKWKYHVRKSNLILQDKMSNNKINIVD